MLDAPETGRYCHGDAVSLADLCLVPQLYNARRWEIALTGLAQIARIGAALEAIEPFAAAQPDQFAPSAGRDTRRKPPS